MRCPRCITGCLHWDEECVRCLNCAVRFYPPLREEYTYQTTRRALAGICPMCLEAAISSGHFCRSCAIKEGFAKARGRG